MGEELAKELGEALNKFHSVPKVGHNDLLNGRNHEVTEGSLSKSTFFQALVNAMVS